MQDLISAEPFTSPETKLVNVESSEAKAEEKTQKRVSDSSLNSDSNGASSNQT
jgi:hypothetical protein